mgnify:CR=1 FL=1
MIILKSDNFILREWALDDVHYVVKNANNINVWNNLTEGFPQPYTEQASIDYINSQNGKPKPHEFAIVVDNNAVGGVSVFPRDNIYHITAEIGYWLGEAYWGKGIMTEAVKLISEYMFRDFDIIKIFAGVFDYNTPSMRVLEKAGFVKEAILTKGAIKNNKISDLHYYSLFKP